MKPMDEVLDYLKKNPTYYLATVDAKGNPQVRPFGTITAFEGSLYFQTGNVKDVFKQIMEHPHIAISATGDGGTSWLRLTADAVRDDRREARAAVLADYPDLQKLYSPDDGNCEVLALEHVTATFCSFASEPRTVEF